MSSRSWPADGDGERGKDRKRNKGNKGRKEREENDGQDGKMKGNSGKKKRNKYTCTKHCLAGNEHSPSSECMTCPDSKSYSFAV